MKIIYYLMRDIMKPLVPGKYPEKFEKYVRIKDGTRIFIRPIKPEDSDLWVQFYLSLSRMAKYYRFFSSRSEPDKKMIKKYTQIDYINDMALIAIVSENEKQRMIGVARYVIVKKTGGAEIAVVISDDWQGKGLGTKLLINLLDIIIKRNIPKLCGDVFLENDKMMKIIKDSGFKLISKNDMNVKHFEIKLK